MDDDRLLDDEFRESVAVDVTDMVNKKLHKQTKRTRAYSARNLTVGLALVCIAFLGVINYFELSIVQRGSAELNFIHAHYAFANDTAAAGCAESKANGVLPAVTNDTLASIDYVPNHVIYPPSVFSSSLVEPIPLEDALHHAMLHEACLKYSESIVEWQYARNNNMSKSHLIHRDDPDLFNKIRQCPDIDIYHPLGIRGNGYCEDSVAYLKYLESRILPQWVLEDSFEDPVSKKKYRYYELCPKTPVIMFNRYWYDDRADWPSTKKLYVMPNIEMGQLQAPEYWSADAILCKTAICARRATKWFKQNGNPRKARVFYTRHSSADIATLAKWRSGEKVVKNFSNMVFAHASGGSPFKGTHQVFGCWMSRPDFPPLKVVIDKGRYNDA
ncbi:hypothetical protein AeNC1_009834, partial [Aphanomyces euteiches]